jgi:hypothetical protein
MCRTFTGSRPSVVFGPNHHVEQLKEASSKTAQLYAFSSILNNKSMIFSEFFSSNVPFLGIYYFQISNQKLINNFHASCHPYLWSCHRHMGRKYAERTDRLKMGKN